MKDQRKEFGRRGEDRAAAFFLLRGFRIIERNWSCRMGEIDLICRKNGVTRFIEVKTRRTRAFGNPEESITAGKMQRLERAVLAYMSSKELSWDNVHVDALAILAEPGKPPEYHYLEDILGA